MSNVFYSLKIFLRESFIAVCLFFFPISCFAASAQITLDSSQPLDTESAQSQNLQDKPFTNFAKRDKHFLYLTYENDSNFDDSVDKYYTAGVRIAYHSKEFSPESKTATILRHIGIFPYFYYDTIFSSFGVFFAQEIYAPKDRFSTIPPRDDHPYAGYLYVDLMSQNRSEYFLEQIELHLGLVGPSAGGKQMQGFIHKLTHNKILAGWDTQLRDEFVANMYYRLSYSVPYIFRASKGYVDLMPQASFALGKAKIYSQSRLVFRFG